MENKYLYIVSNLSEQRTREIANIINDEATILYAIDCRTALYLATGIAEQNLEKVIVLVDENNTSRSAFSGMTEAFYRKLPIILVTIGSNVDYSKKINDTINSFYSINSFEELLLIDDMAYPAHIEVAVENYNYEKVNCEKVQHLLQGKLINDEYLYVGQGIKNEGYDYKCKVVNGGTVGCFDGAVANVLGASLSGMRDKYVALITDIELLHDINTLGNINMNDTVKIIALCSKSCEYLGNIAATLGFNVEAVNEIDIDKNIVGTFINSAQKGLLLVKR